MSNKAGLTGQTVPGRRIPGHWPYPGPEELAEAELVGPDAWTFLSLAKVVYLRVNQRHPQSNYSERVSLLNNLAIVSSSLEAASGSSTK